MMRIGDEMSMKITQFQSGRLPGLIKFLAPSVEHVIDIESKLKHLEHIIARIS